MKIIVTTSDKYHHLLPVFFYLYNKYWGDDFELVGYAKPECELPANCTWVSLGVQGEKHEFSTDLRKYFEQQPDWFVWMMEDTFVKEKICYDFLILNLYFNSEITKTRLSFYQPDKYSAQKQERTDA